MLTGVQLAKMRRMMWRRTIRMEKAYPVEDNFTKDTLRAGVISLFGEEAGSHMKNCRDKKYFMDVIHANLFERDMSMDTFILELFKLSGIQYDIPTEVALTNDEPRFVSKEVIYAHVFFRDNNKKFFFIISHH
jgi:hypothetical protein